MAAASCGGKYPKAYPVSGKVLVNGQPAKDCQVTLVRTGGPDLPMPVTPNGVTDEKGEFRLTTYAVDDGAPEGDYVVTIEWRDRSGLAQSEFGGPDRLGGEYAKTDKTKGLPGFVVKVGQQAVILPPFELKQSDQAKRKYEEAKKRPASFGGPLGGGDK
jgi:hypothetical protein